MSNLAEAFCQECGCSWFEVVGADLDPTEFTGLGAMRFTGTGNITGYNGVVVCRECGAPATFPMVSRIPTAIAEDDIALVELPPLVVIEPRTVERNNQRSNRTAAPD